MWATGGGKNAEHKGLSKNHHAGWPVTVFRTALDCQATNHGVVSWISPPRNSVNGLSLVSRR